MAGEKKDLINALNASIRELQHGIDTHCCLINSLMKGEIDESGLQALRAQCPKRSREQRLEEAVKEAIDILEESRKSFKSKQLAALRKRLTQVLIENE